MFEWITTVIGRLGYTGVALLTFLENLLPPIPSELVIPLAGFAAAEGDMRLRSVPAGFARMPLTSYLLYSAFGTVVWTTALAYAGVVLQSNVGIVGDYVNAITYGVFSVLGVMIARRYIRCWKDASG